MLIAPRPPEEAQRLAALHAYHAFRTGPEPGFDRITALASRTLGISSAYVSLVGEDSQWLKSCFNLPGPRETGRDIAFCAHAILCDDVFVVPDATLDPRFFDNPLVTGPPYIRFYAGCPLRCPSGHSVGTLCAIDAEPRVPSAEMLATLKDLAALVVDQLELRKWVIEEESRQKHDAETNYRRLADAIHGMVIRFRIAPNAEREHLYASPGAVELLGITPQQYCGSSNALQERVHPEDLEGFCAANEAIVRDGRDWDWVGRVVATDGKTKWVRAEGRSELQADGSRIVEGLIIDVTASKDREEALSEAKETAERANRAKSEFLSRMSHELRTPMNAILGFAQMLEMEPLGPDAKEDLAQVSKAGEHLLGLINDVLDLASLDAKRVAMSIEPVRLDDVLSETFGLLRPMSEARNVRVTVTPALGDVFVRADRQRLKQVVINLLTNAVKYNRPDGRITVTVRREADGLVALDVADEGIGISPEMVERLFTPFDRLGAESTGIEGTGLGLAISRGFVEGMGGSLALSSVLGKGSVFTVRLPSEASPLSALPPLVEPPVACEVAKRSVLYVEDNESNVLLVRRVLRQRPEVRLTTAKSVAEGLDLLAQSEPDVLLLDLNLPDGSGDEIIHWVRTRSPFPKLPVVVLSADATPRQAERVLAAGADNYLTKPLNLPAFFRAFDASLKEARL